LRRIPLSHRSHIIGFQPLTTGIAEHESALERDFVTVTSFLEPGASITSQPVTISFLDVEVHTSLLRRAGLPRPVQPAKGYSVTFDDQETKPSLAIPLIDDQLRDAIVRLHGAIRVAGTAEFTGFDLSLNPDRIHNLSNLMRKVLPEGTFNRATARAWCGLRAMSADGVPIIGATPLSNLLVNCGHGHLGWTMAAGSAALLVDIISRDTPAIDPIPYRLKRFA
jgi:D-amino-acid dehydrogenase